MSNEEKPKAEKSKEESKEDKTKVDIREDEKDLVLDHDYDGIKELDHPLPLWWVFIFIGTVVFSIPYYFYYVHADGPDSRTVLEEKMEKIRTLQEEHEAKAGGFDVEKYKRFVASEEASKLGKKAYQGNCAACHGQKGEGVIGPNLTDKYWLHGDGKLASVFQTIAKGVPNKGMPAWKQSLSEKELMAVTDYVMEFKGKNLEGKAPQGELIKE